MNVLLLSPYYKSLTPALNEFGDSFIECSSPIDSQLCIAHSIDFLVSYGYRHKIQKEVLDLFPLRAVNLHISYLPCSRGAHPNFWSIAERSPVGVTIHLLDRGLDTGNILFQKEVYINESEHTFSSSHHTLCCEIERLFFLNWKYIRKAQSSGWHQQGQSTYHRVADLDSQWKDCLPQMWDTPITVFRKLASARV